MSFEKIGRSIKQYYISLKDMRIETLFIIIFIAFGAIFAFMVPPGWNTDEPDHTYRVYQLSSGNLFSEKVTGPTGLKAYGGEVPTGLVNLYTQAGVKDGGANALNTGKRVNDLYQVKPEILTLKDDGSRTTINFSGAALYSPVAYAVYIPTFEIGKLLSLPFFQTIILSRLVGVVLTGLAFFFAIKYIPIGKWMIFAVGLLPVVVGQAATVGADAPQIAISVLFLACITRLIFGNRKPRIVDYILMTTLGAALVLIKLVYAPFILLLLAVPLVRRDCRDKKSMLMVALAVIFAIIPGIIWLHLVAYIDINSNPQANFELQKAFILDNPVLYLKTLYYTFFTNEQLALNGIFGNFIWASAPLPAMYTYLASASLLFSLVVQSSREAGLRALNNRYRIWRISLLIVSGMTAILIATALYIYSTTLHQSSIVGIQARYFIPVVPALLLVLYGNVVKNQQIVKVGIVFISCVVLVGAILTVYNRLYQTLPMILQ